LSTGLCGVRMSASQGYGSDDVVRVIYGCLLKIERSLLQ
jgi:hypothetical protein